MRVMTIISSMVSKRPGWRVGLGRGSLGRCLWVDVSSREECAALQEGAFCTAGVSYC